MIDMDPVHLQRILDARVRYFSAITSVLAESQTAPPDCLVEELLESWPDIRAAVKQARTDNELYEAARLAYYACAAADQLLDGSGHAAIWTLHALSESCKRFAKERGVE